MLGKALIATILGAGVTGGAVYLSQHPEALNMPAKSEPVIETGSEFGTAADNAVTPEPVAPNVKPVEIKPVKPSQIEDKKETSTTPVLPESQQLTVRRPVEPAAIVATPDETTATLIAQAKQIVSPDLRDQAYMGVVDYALFTDDFGSAVEAMNALEQPQLRDTARANIAVKYAKTGKTKEAFDLIEQVEIDELRDFMRLQVIDAMTNGQN